MEIASTNIAIRDLHLESRRLQRLLLKVRGDRDLKEARRMPEYKAVAKQLTVNDKKLSTERKTLASNMNAGQAAWSSGRAKA